MTRFPAAAAMVPLLGIAPTDGTSNSLRDVTSFPASYDIFSGNFQQPKTPLICTEFKANWNQHQWAPNMSHIASGYIYNSPSNQKIRVDEAFDSNFASSLFDYTDISSDGLVSNTLYTLAPCIAATPQFWQGYVMPVFPLFSSDILVTCNAVFTGVVDDRFNGKVASWSIMYKDIIPVTVYLDASDTLVGYDFYRTESRTRVVTRYFNIVTGKLDAKFFGFPKQGFVRY